MFSTRLYVSLQKPRGAYMTFSHDLAILKHRFGWKSTLSYKHNNLMAMRLRYWQETSASVQQNKQSLKAFLEQQQLFTQVSEHELEYFFFSLPSYVVMKAHSLGFDHHQVMDMMTTYITTYRQQLSRQQEIKIKYRL